MLNIPFLNIEVFYRQFKKSTYPDQASEIWDRTFIYFYIAIQLSRNKSLQALEHRITVLLFFRNTVIF